MRLFIHLFSCYSLSVMCWALILMHENVYFLWLPKKADTLCWPFSVIWIDSDALLKTPTYLLCDFYNDQIQNCWPVQQWLHSIWNLWKTCPTKINFMIIGTVCIRYTELSTLCKLVLVIPPQCLEARFCYYYPYFIRGKWPWKVKQLAQHYIASWVETG